MVSIAHTTVRCGVSSSSHSPSSFLGSDNNRVCVFSEIFSRTHFPLNSALFHLSHSNLAEHQHMLRNESLLQRSTLSISSLLPSGTCPVAEHGHQETGDTSLGIGGGSEREMLGQTLLAWSNTAHTARSIAAHYGNSLETFDLHFGLRCGYGQLSWVHFPITRYSW